VVCIRYSTRGAADASSGVYCHEQCNYVRMGSTWRWWWCRWLRAGVGRRKRRTVPCTSWIQFFTAVVFAVIKSILITDSSGCTHFIDEKFILADKKQLETDDLLWIMIGYFALFLLVVMCCHPVNATGKRVTLLTFVWWQHKLSLEGGNNFSMIACNFSTVHVGQYVKSG